MTQPNPRILFVTGKLAEPALRRVLADLAPRAGFEPEVAVLNITVAALMTANWVARHLPAGIAADRLILPGFCRGDVAEVTAAAGVPAELGPKDLRDLPEFFGKRSNVDRVRDWHAKFPHAEVVAIPDTPSDLDSLARTVDVLRAAGVKHRLDPILEPIGFGFAASLGRYLDARRRFPDAELMMGIGNLTELTDVDTAGVNVVLAGFCQEVGVRSVLATEVINWARSAVREFDLARRLVYHAVREKVLPKRLEPNLVVLRDPKLVAMGDDRNYRIFAERGELHIFNGTTYVRGTDPFELFQQLLAADAKLDPAHAFYLGYECAKAVTAMTLGKNYTQDQALRWGFLTVPEVSHRGGS